MKEDIRKSKEIRKKILQIKFVNVTLFIFLLEE